MLILLVEDDLSLAELVIEYLETEGMECDHAFAGPQAIELIKQTNYDVIVLDINLPGCSGLEVCEEMRQLGVTTPCIMLTARGSLEDKLSGFDAGTDDYLVKPFAMAELAVRIMAQSKRQRISSVLTIADLEIKSDSHQVFRGGKEIKISPDEWKLLLHLAQKSPQVVSRTELEDLLWPDGESSADALKMVIYRLRKAIDTKGLSPLIHTVRGIGVSLRQAS